MPYHPQLCRDLPWWPSFTTTGGTQSVVAAILPGIVFPAFFPCPDGTYVCGLSGKVCTIHTDGVATTAFADEAPEVSVLICPRLYEVGGFGAFRLALVSAFTRALAEIQDRATDIAAQGAQPPDGSAGFIDSVENLEADVLDAHRLLVPLTGVITLYGCGGDPFLTRLKGSFDGPR